MRTFLPHNTPLPQLVQLLQGAVAPRPIALVSSQDAEGRVNLSPFSFFNIFSLQPPVLVFSPSRRVRDNTIKHTLENALACPEVVVNIVDYQMVMQTSLSSTEYERGVDEFVKSGLTPLPSTLVRPPRVAESPAQFECKVLQVIPLGEGGGAGNLVVCEVIAAHFADRLFDEEGKIDPRRADLVARMGGDWYCRALPESLFLVPKPLANKGMGVDALPEAIRLSGELTGNDLGKLGNCERLPDAQQLQETHLQLRPEWKGLSAHALAHALLQEDRLAEAWKVLLG